MLESFTSLAFSAAFGGYVFIFVRKWKVSQTCPCCIVGARKEVGDSESGEGIGRRASDGSGGTGGDGSPQSPPARRPWSLMGDEREEAGDGDLGDGRYGQDEESGVAGLPSSRIIRCERTWMDSLMLLKQLKDGGLLTASQFETEKTILLQQRMH
jgi:hypothetical protein